MDRDRQNLCVYCDSQPIPSGPGWSRYCSESCRTAAGKFTVSGRQFLSRHRRRAYKELPDTIRPHLVGIHAERRPTLPSGRDEYDSVEIERLKRLMLKGMRSEARSAALALQDAIYSEAAAGRTAAVHHYAAATQILTDCGEDERYPNALSLRVLQKRIKVATYLYMSQRDYLRAARAILTQAHIYQWQFWVELAQRLNAGQTYTDYTLLLKGIRLAEGLKDALVPPRRGWDKQLVAHVVHQVLMVGAELKNNLLLEMNRPTIPDDPEQESLARDAASPWIKLSTGRALVAPPIVWSRLVSHQRTRKLSLFWIRPLDVKRIATILIDRTDEDFLTAEGKARSAELHANELISSAKVASPSLYRDFPNRLIWQIGTPVKAFGVPSAVFVHGIPEPFHEGPCLYTFYMDELLRSL